MAISPTQGSSLGSILESQGPTPKVRQASESPEAFEFKEILSEAGSVRVESPAAKTPAATVSITEQSTAADPKTEPAVVLQGPKTDNPIATTEPALEQKSLTVVRDALIAAGVRAHEVKLSYREEMVWYPGGNWINHYITATTSDGRSMDFSAKLAERSPQVTATEIDSYLLKGGGVVS